MGVAQLVDVGAKLVTQPLTLRVVPVGQRLPLMADDQLRSALGHGGLLHGLREGVAQSVEGLTFFARDCLPSVMAECLRYVPRAFLIWTTGDETLEQEAVF